MKKAVFLVVVSSLACIVSDVGVPKRMRVNNNFAMDLRDDLLDSGRTCRQWTWAVGQSAIHTQYAGSTYL